MNGAKFINGSFYNGFISSSLWYNGTFYSGVFLGDKWFNGNFYGGDFSNGIWKNGIVSSYKKDVLTRFGTDYNHINLEVTYTDQGHTQTYSKPQGCVWENGQFMSGEFHSRLNLTNNQPLESNDHNISNWLNGQFNNGDWYGGTFHNGTWKNGTFHNGVINDIIFQNGYIKNCNWKNGEFINGNIEGGVFNNMEFNNGNIGV